MLVKYHKKTMQEKRGCEGRYKYIVWSLFIFAAIVSLMNAGHVNAQNIHAELYPVELFSIEWGDSEGEVGFLRTPGRNYGPQSFAVDEENRKIYILDSTHQRISIYDVSGSLHSSIPISQRADDLCLGDSGNIFVLYTVGKEVVEYGLKGSVIETYPFIDTSSPVQTIFSTSEHDLFFKTADGTSYPLKKNGMKINREAQTQGKISGTVRNNEAFFLERKNSSQGIIKILDFDANIRKEIQVLKKGQNIQCLYLIDTDDEGNAYVVIEESTNHFEVTRCLRKYNREGSISEDALIPYSNYVYTFNDLRVTKSGKIYQMLPLKEHVKVLLWTVNVVKAANFSEFYDSLFSDTSRRPEDFLSGDLIKLDSKKTNLEDDTASIVSSAYKSWESINRSEIMERAESYANHTFWVGTKNISLITGMIETPLTEPGHYTGVCYKWGGFSGLVGVTLYTDCNYFFDEGLQADKFAGNINTDWWGSCSAVGVDCSGFVSQSWGLDTKYSTSTLKDISDPLSSKEYLLEGDILDWPGHHVMLFVQRESDGAYTVYEASSWDWKVSKRSYYSYQLGDYSPYQYQNLRCTYSISPISQSFDSDGGENSVSVFAQDGCEWTATSNVDWINISPLYSQGNGDGTVYYEVDPNPNTSSRTGEMNIAGNSFTVTQSGMTCTYSISPTSQSFTSDGGTGSVGVTAPTGCSWTTTRNAKDSWITITSGSSGSGNGSVTYFVTANSSGSPRTGMLKIAGEKFTIEQSQLSGDNSPWLILWSSAGTGGECYENQEARFKAEAGDSEDGDLTSRITWLLDGVSVPHMVTYDAVYNRSCLTIPANTLSAGEHIIIAQVTDSGGKSKKSEFDLNVKPEIPTADNATIVVRAKGTPAGGVWPLMELWISACRDGGFGYVDKVPVRDREYRTYRFDHVNLNGARYVRLRFPNDAVINGEDRNLWVDYAVINNKVRQAESGGIRYKITNAGANDWVPGQELMAWEGSLDFPLIYDFIDIVAVGQKCCGCGDGECWPKMDLWVNGRAPSDGKWGLLFGWTYPPSKFYRCQVASSPYSHGGYRVYREYLDNLIEYDSSNYRIPLDMPDITSIYVKYINDCHSPGGSEDRNLFVQSVSFGYNLIKSSDIRVRYERFDGAPDTYGTGAMYWGGKLHFTKTIPHGGFRTLSLLEPDPDNDGMPDDWETQYGLNPLINDATQDADCDGLTNLEEYQHGTNPVNADTDIDGMYDGWEVQYGLNPLSNDGVGDLDGDGLTNLAEYRARMNPASSDTDGDGMSDAWEVRFGLNPLADDASGDHDSDALSNLKEYQLGTIPTNGDTDGDGMPDGWEISHFGNFLCDGTEDDDFDGLTDREEYNYGTNPRDEDTDGDGYSDGYECVAGTDPLDENDVPVDPNITTNIALSRPATQSSNNFGTTGAEAVDGDTDGNFANGSVTHTHPDDPSWWQVDLGANSFVSEVRVFNRTDCCSERLSNFDVMISEDGETWEHIINVPGQAENPTTVNFGGVYGRYVRVQLTDINYLSLTEVEVMGITNIAQGKPTTMSSYNFGTTGAEAVDGNTDGNFANGSVTHTHPDNPSWWQVDLEANSFISEIWVYNRTDCCSERLSNFDVMISEDGETWEHIINVPGQAENPTTVNFGGVYGRYVRVQLTDINYLSLTEVEVMGITNIAQGKPTTMSSYNFGTTGAEAVDGNTDGNFANGSVTHTHPDNPSWWQVDLEANSFISEIWVYNRTDCCSERLSNFDVMISEDGETWDHIINVPGEAENPTTVNFGGVYGRYVRVQLTDINYLSLTEVEVMGTISQKILSPVDTDEDGLPDDWEMDCFGDLLRDGMDDYDSDGLTNKEEYNNGTDPTNKDTDGDGYLDGHEYYAGTDPLDPQDHPVALAFFVDDEYGDDANHGRDLAHAKKTIQAGIDAASDGEIVVVRDGTYTGSENKNLNFSGKAITIRSENGAENAIIDCENDGRGVCFHAGETYLSILEGFTITNGNAVDGGGINIWYSSPTITKCFIKNNKAESGGGGIRCDGSSAVISNCEIIDNRAKDGAGIGCWRESSPTITNCIISDNTATEGWGGGIFLSASSSDITDCIIRNNTAVQSGGIECTDGSSPTISACTIKGNQASNLGGGIRCYRGALPIISNCIITANQAPIGGGIVCQDYAEPFFVNCTIADNEAGSYGGGIVCHGYPSWPTLTNCILCGNAPDEVACGTADITYSDIDQEGYAGSDGNIRLDPLFAGNGDYHLTVDSPCIDAGTNSASEFPDIDFEGDPRIVDGDQDGIATVDIGADEFAIDQSQLVLLFLFEDNGGTTRDISQNGDDGTVNGAVFTSGQGLLSSNAYRLSWSNQDNIQAPYQESQTATEALTLEDWIYPTAWDNIYFEYNRIISKQPVV